MFNLQHSAYLPQLTAAVQSVHVYPVGYSQLQGRLHYFTPTHLNRGPINHIIRPILQFNPESGVYQPTGYVQVPPFPTPRHLQYPLQGRINLPANPEVRQPLLPTPRSQVNHPWLNVPTNKDRHTKQLFRQLEQAIYSNDTETLQLLIKIQPELLRTKNAAGLVPIQIAASRGNKETCEALLAAAPEHLNLKEEHTGNNLLHKACMRSNAEAAEAFIRYNPRLLREKNKENSLPIHLAAGATNQDNEELINLLINSYPQGVIIKSGYLYDQTPLYLAARAGNPKVLKRLIEEFPKGVKIGSTTGLLPLHEVATLYYPYTHYVNSLDTLHPDTLNHFRKLIEKKIQCIQYLYAAYPESISKQDRLAQTALIRGAHSNDVEVIKLLIALDPQSVLTQDNFGNTALHNAAMSCRNTDNFKVLAQKAPHLLSTKNNEGRTPIDILFRAEREDEENPEKFTNSLTPVLLPILQKISAEQFYSFSEDLLSIFKAFNEDLKKQTKPANFFSINQRSRLGLPLNLPAEKRRSLENVSAYKQSLRCMNLLFNEQITVNGRTRTLKEWLDHESKPIWTVWKTKNPTFDIHSLKK